MTIKHEEAVKEVTFLIESGGINPSNCEYVQGIIKKFGADAHVVFQEASEQIATLVAAGIVVEPDAKAAAELS